MRVMEDVVERCHGRCHHVTFGGESCKSPLPSIHCAGHCNHALIIDLAAVGLFVSGESSCPASPLPTFGTVLTPPAGWGTAGTLIFAGHAGGRESLTGQHRCTDVTSSSLTENPRVNSYPTAKEVEVDTPRVR